MSEVQVAHRECATVVATAGCGKFRQWAARLATRSTMLQGAPCLDLSDVADWSNLPHPAWVKARLWDMLPEGVDRVVWLDADVYPLRRMLLADVPDDVYFAAMPESCEPPDCEKKKMPSLTGTYYNAGIFVASRRSKSLFDVMKRKMHDLRQGCYYDQSWFNVLLGGKAYPLQTTWNWMIDSDDPPAGTMNVHAAGLGGESRWKVLRALYATGGVTC